MFDSAVNGPSADIAPFIDPAERFLLFASNRAGGAGAFDLYVSVNRGGRWQPARALGPAVNTAASESNPAVSPDGRRLLFSRNVDGRSRLYEVRFDERATTRADSGTITTGLLRRASSGAALPGLLWSRGPARGMAVLISPDGKAAMQGGAGAASSPVVRLLAAGYDVFGIDVLGQMDAMMIDYTRRQLLVLPRGATSGVTMKRRGIPTRLPRH